jgi:tetratricopeptide (TPR) repeat protein
LNVRWFRPVLAVWVAAAAFAAGCVVRQDASASPFVKRGKPKTEYPVKMLMPPDDAERLKKEQADVRELARQSVRPPRPQLESLESTDPALKEALRAIGAHPTVGGHLAVAAAYRRLGVVDQAIEHYDAALALDRKSAAAYDGRARLWRDSKRPDLALPDATRAVHYAPQSPETLNTLGTVLLALGNVPEAQRTFARVLALDPTAAYAQRNSAIAARLAPPLAPHEGAASPESEP